MRGLIEHTIKIKRTRNMKMKKYIGPRTGCADRIPGKSKSPRTILNCVKMHFVIVQ